MLRLEGVRVSLDGAEVVKGIDIGVDDGEWLGLIGPNGAGKTTVLRAVAGLVPYSGSDPDRERRGIGASAPRAGAARGGRAADSR